MDWPFFVGGVIGAIVYSALEDWWYTGRHKRPGDRTCVNCKLYRTRWCEELYRLKDCWRPE